MVTLTHAGFSLSLAPAAGGSVTGLTWRGQPLLRASTDPRNPLAGAGFPMVPFCGRIDQGRFSWDGQLYTLTRNFPPEPHAIHGLGWQQPWAVDDIAGDSVTLVLRHGPATVGDWQWALEARQTFTLADTGLELALSLKNTDTTPMPAGMGWHPYFPRGDAVLEAPVTAVWAADAGGISTGTAALDRSNDLRLPRALATIPLDHAFECGAGTAGASARMVWPERDLCLLMSATPGLGRLVVYAPPGGDFFCVEPLSHAPDAINRAPPHAANGLRVLEPGEVWEETVRLDLG
jgi:aldose 1-epimerase